MPMPPGKGTRRRPSISQLAEVVAAGNAEVEHDVTISLVRTQLDEKKKKLELLRDKRKARRSQLQSKGVELPEPEPGSGGLRDNEVMDYPSISSATGSTRARERAKARLAARKAQVAAAAGGGHSYPAYRNDTAYPPSLIGPNSIFRPLEKGGSVRAARKAQTPDGKLLLRGGVDRPVRSAERDRDPPRQRTTETAAQLMDQKASNIWDLVNGILGDTPAEYKPTSAAAVSLTNLPAPSAPVVRAGATSSSQTSPNTGTTSASSERVLLSTFGQRSTTTFTAQAHAYTLRAGGVSSEDIAPSPIVKYERGVQTSSFEDADVLSPEEELEAERKRLDMLREQKRRQREQQEQQEKLQAHAAAQAQSQKALSAKQKQEIIESAEFHEFFARSSAIIERALYQNIRGSSDADAGGLASLGRDDRKGQQDDYEYELEEGAGVTSRLLLRADAGKSTTVDRPVTDTNWSPTHKELVLAAYAGKAHSHQLSSEPDGLVLLWSTELPFRPEYSFYAQSAVLSARFHPSEPKLIVGALQSGQIVLWDSRAKRTPVSRSAWGGHTQPVYSLAMLPSLTHLHHMVTMSTDGVMCEWQGEHLKEPSARWDLRWEKTTVSASCLSVSHRDSNRAIVGGTDGMLYNVAVRDSPGVQSSISAHDAPVTQVAFHPAGRSEHKEYADLFISSSFDWTAKLWHGKTNTLLCNFESARDYVYDVAWSPSHPGVFAAGDGAGVVDFWDLSCSTEVPMGRARLFNNDLFAGDEQNSSGTRGRFVSNSGLLHVPQRATGRANSSSSSSSNLTVPNAHAGRRQRDVYQRTVAVSKLAWADEGDRLVVGGSDGSLLVCGVASRLQHANGEAQDRLYSTIKKAWSAPPTNRLAPNQAQPPGAARFASSPPFV